MGHPADLGLGPTPANGRLEWAARRRVFADGNTVQGQPGGNFRIGDNPSRTRMEYDKPPTRQRFAPLG
jgi:hypothetical protein